MTELQKIADWQVFKPRSTFGRQELDPERCVASVHDGSRHVTFHQCTRIGSIEECGYKWCKTHAPSNVLRKRQEQDEKYKIELEAMHKRSDRHKAKDNILNVACDYFRQEATHEQLELAVIQYLELKDD